MAIDAQETLNGIALTAGDRENQTRAPLATVSVAGLCAAILIGGYWLFLSTRQISFDSIIDGFIYIQMSFGDEQPLGYDTPIREPGLPWILGLVAPARSQRFSLMFFTALGLGALLWAVGYLRMTGSERLRCAIVLCASVTVFVLVGNLWRQYLAAVLLVASVARPHRSRIAAITIKASPLLFHISSAVVAPSALLASLRMRRATMFATCILIMVPIFLVSRALAQRGEWEMIGGYLGELDAGWVRRLKLVAEVSLMLAATRESALSRLAVFSSASCLAIVPDGLFSRFSYYPALAIAAQVAAGVEETRRAKLAVGLYVAENVIGLALSRTFLRALGMAPENLGI